MTYIVLKAPYNVLTIIYRKLPKATTVVLGIYHWRHQRGHMKFSGTHWKLEIPLQCICIHTLKIV